MKIKRTIKRCDKRLKKAKDTSEAIKAVAEAAAEISSVLASEILGYDMGKGTQIALSAAFQVASNALIQPYADKDYLEDIREAFLSSAVSVSTIRKVPNDE